MTAQKGSLVLLKVGNGGGPETFATVGGMRITRMVLNNTLVETTHRGSGAWRQVADASGIRSVNISGEGAFVDSASEETLRGYAFAASANNYELTFGNGDKLTGAFIVERYERSGDVEQEETYRLSLQSAGAVSFVVG